MFLKRSITLLLSITYLFSFSGHIEENTTWDEDIIITGDVYVDEGATLTIMPGVSVSFSRVDQNQDGIGDSDFIVNGKLVCNGSPGNEVIFTSNEDNPVPGDWAGIDIQSSVYNSTILNTKILFAYQGVYQSGKAVTYNHVLIEDAANFGMHLNNSTDGASSLFDLTIENCGDYGFNMSNGSANMNDFNILNNAGYGMNINAGTVNYTDGLIFGNGDYGLNLESNVTIETENVVVSSNASTGIWIDGTQSAQFNQVRSVSNGEDGVLIEGSDPVFTNSLISDNNGYGIRILEVASQPEFTYCNIIENFYGGIVFEDGADGSFVYNNIINNGLEGESGCGLCIIENSTPIINYNNIYGNNPGQSVSIPINSLHIQNTGYSAFFDLGFPVIDGVTQFYIDCYGDHNHSNDDYEFIIQDNANNWLYTYIRYNVSSDTNYEGWVTAFDSGSSNIRVYLNTYSVSNPYGRITKVYNGSNFFSSNSSTSYLIDAQYNWWGQINGVDSLIFQNTAGTVNYDEYLTESVVDAGVSMANIPPVFTLTGPTAMVIDPSTITISWSDMDVDDDAEISLYYSNAQDSTGTLITAGISEDDESDVFSWDVSTVPDGIYYVYGVLDDGTNEPVISYAPSQIMVGPLSVSIHNNLQSPTGTAFTVSVEIINPLEEFDIVAFSFTLSYDLTLLEITDVVNSETLTSGWTINSNLDIPGQTTVVGYSTQPIVERGTLLNFTFNVNESAENLQTSNLNLIGFTFNEGDPVPEINDGLFTVINHYDISGSLNYYSSGIGLPGAEVTIAGDTLLQLTTTDSSGSFSFLDLPSTNYELTAVYDDSIPDLVITPYDASLIAQFEVGTLEFNAQQMQAADVTGNGTPTVLDAAEIARYAVGLTNNFDAGRWILYPDGFNYQLQENVGNELFQAIAIGDPSGNWEPPDRNHWQTITVNAEAGEIVDIPVAYTGPFQSFYLDLIFSSEVFDFEEFQAISLLDNFTIENNIEAGRIRIGGYNSDIVNSTHEVYSVKLEALETLSNEIIQIRSIFDENDAGVLLDIQNNETALKSFSLKQSFPNPFNPKTTIKWEMPAPAEYRLSAYNVIGELVSEISNGFKNSGIHTIEWDAENLPSGVYFLQLEIDGRIIDRQKLILLK